MGKKATKAADNVYCIARYKAAETNEAFESRERTSEIVGIDRTRLARIELGSITPYPEEALILANAYGAPELCNSYCAKECPIGKLTIQEIAMDDFDRLALKVLGSLKDIEALRMQLIDIAEDGVIGEDEHDDFNSVLQELQKISMNAQALRLWAAKHIQALRQIK